MSGDNYSTVKPARKEFFTVKNATRGKLKKIEDPKPKINQPILYPNCGSF